MWQRRNVREMKKNKNDGDTQLNKVVIFRRQRPRVSVQSVSCRSNLERLTNKSVVVVWTVVQDRHIVYKIPCAHCPHSYIGQTSHRLCQHVAEHKRAVKQADHTTSALSEHAWSTGHPVDWDNVSVLNNCPDYYHRLISESFLIGGRKGRQIPH